MLKEKVEKALNNQIELEAYSSQLYLSMASWAEKNGYPGSSAFLYKHAEEERIHMLKLFHYINERDGHAIVPALKQPPFQFDSVKSVFKQILEHEIFISESINNLLGVCLESNDFSTQNFLQWYVTEQIEEESLAKTNIDKLNLMGEANLYLFDKEMQGLSVQNAAAAEPAA
jgi:ferritin